MGSGEEAGALERVSVTWYPERGLERKLEARGLPNKRGGMTR